MDCYEDNDDFTQSDDTFYSLSLPSSPDIMDCYVENDDFTQSDDTFYSLSSPSSPDSLFTDYVDASLELADIVIQDPGYMDDIFFDAPSFPEIGEISIENGEIQQEQEIIEEIEEIEQDEEQEKRINNRWYGHYGFFITYWSLAIFGGITIGFSSSIIGNILGHNEFFSKFSKKIYEEKKLSYKNNFCPFVSFWIELFVGSIYPIAILSTLLSYHLSNVIGRRPILRLGSLLLLMATALVIIYPGAHFQIPGRLMTGFANGCLQQVIPLMLRELTYGEKNKRNTNIFKCCIPLGYTLAASVVWFSTLFSYWRVGDWRVGDWRFGFIVLFMLVAVLCFTSLLIKETPTFLVMLGRHTEARCVLEIIMGTPDVEEKHNEIKSFLETVDKKNPFSTILKRRCLPGLVIVMLKQLTIGVLDGISTYFSFAPLILSSLSKRTAFVEKNLHFLIPVAYGAVTMIIQAIQPLLMSKFGRKSLFEWTTTAMLLLMFILWPVFQFDINLFLPPHKTSGKLGIICIGAFVILRGILTGPEGWVEEAFPANTAILGEVLALIVSMLMNFITTMGSLYLTCQLKSNIIWFYIVVVLIIGNVIGFLVPDVHKPKKIWQKHWLWHNFLTHEE